MFSKFSKKFPYFSCFFLFLCYNIKNYFLTVFVSKNSFPKIKSFFYAQGGDDRAIFVRKEIILMAKSAKKRTKETYEKQKLKLEIRKIALDIIKTFLEIILHYK